MAGKVFIAGTIGEHAYRFIWHSSWWVPGYVATLISVVGIFLLFYALINAQLELKLFIIYTYGLFLISLFFPMAGPAGISVWQILLGPTSANRYFFLPILAWILTLSWIAFRSQECNFFKNFARVILFFFVFIGIPFGWKLIGYKNFDFNVKARRFEKISPGQVMDFKTNPSGWDLQLKKK